MLEHGAAVALRPTMSMRATSESATAVVVEDCDELRYIMVRLLQRQGFATEAYDNALDALRRWTERGAANLIVTDLALPRMSGAELIAHLSRQGQLAGTAVLLVTASSGVAPPVHDAVVVSKPFAVAEFEAGVRRALSSVRREAGAA